MNIFKRPMFYAALICSLSAVFSLFMKPLLHALIILSIILLLINVFRKNYKYIAVLFAIVLFTINLIVQFVKIEQINTHNQEKISGSFLVSDDIVSSEEFNTVTLKTVNCAVVSKNTKILVFDYDKSLLKIGDVINCTLKLSAIDSYNKYRLSDYGDSIYATAHIVELEKTGEINLIYKTIGKIRTYVKNNVVSYFGDDTTHLLSAITIGDKSLLSDTFLQNIKTTGISHLIVVSGMHLSIIMAVVFFVIDRIFYNKYARCLLSVCVVLFVCTVCGCTMSVIRAGVFFSVAAFASVFNRESDLLNSLFTAITLVLICAPFAILNISFQLSVLSTLAIVWAVPFYYDVLIKKFKISSKFIKSIISMVMCSIFAALFTLPVAIKTFGFVSIIMPITNIIVILPISLALVANIAALFLHALPVIKFLSYPLFYIAGLCSKLIIVLVNTLAKLPITVAVLPKNAFWWSLLIIAVIVGYMYFYEFKIKGSDLIADSL